MTTSPDWAEVKAAETVAGWCSLHYWAYDSNQHTELQSLIAVALREARGEWRPISDAPKDRWLWLYRPLPDGDYTMERARWKSNGFGKSFWGGNGWSYPDWNQPTHFRAIPEPPEVT